MPVLSNTSLAKFEKGIAIAIWAAAACGFGWAMNPKVVTTSIVVTFVASAALWLPLFAAIVQAPLWMTRWANDSSDGSPKLRVQELPSQGRHLFMDANLLQPIEGHLILPRVGTICASSALFALLTAIILLICWWNSGHPWVLAAACVFGALLGWEIYPRPGIRYSTFLVMRQAVLRDLCMVAFGRGLQEPKPISEWHASYFDILMVGPYDSDQEPKAVLWLYLYALCKGELDTASRLMERYLGLPMPEAADQYVGLGTAVHFYAAVVPDPRRTETLVKQIRAIQWDLPISIEYIEASIALAEGRPDDALSIAQAHLDCIGMEGGNARVQLQRAMVVACRNRALQPNAL